LVTDSSRIIAQTLTGPGRYRQAMTGVVLAAPQDSWLWWHWVVTHLKPGVEFSIADATWQHIELTVIAVVVGTALALPLGVLVWKTRWLETPVLGIAGILYTVPSLALFALLVPITGLSTLTAEIGLVSYTLLIIIRNVVAGLDGVPADVRDAAVGMGFSPVRQFFGVELPLAVPAIIAGVRIATVTTIGLVTVTALIGKGGLGSLIYDGLTRDFKTPLTVGAVVSVLLAVVADSLLVALQRLLTPWARRGR
jgi:osmoprotectant transport system permease protein